jgi:hypothetical protein
MIRLDKKATLKQLFWRSLNFFIVLAYIAKKIAFKN